MRSKAGAEWTCIARAEVVTGYQVRGPGSTTGPRNLRSMIGVEGCGASGKRVATANLLP